mgnify:CR=1 FL=1
MMAAYVDDLRTTPRSKKWPFGFACHMFADTPEELDSFAARIGLNPSWLQEGNKGHPPHFDLTRNMRARALASGAMELKTNQEVVNLWDRIWTTRPNYKGGA